LIARPRRSSSACNAWTASACARSQGTACTATPWSRPAQRQGLRAGRDGER
jgi:hypothetical protein